MNDPAGDCGISVAFTFDSESKARKFAQSPGVGAWLPIDTGKHVFINWEPMLNKKSIEAARMAGQESIRTRFGLLCDAITMRQDKNRCAETIAAELELENNLPENKNSRISAAILPSEQ